MTEALWTEVDQYIVDTLGLHDELLGKVQDACDSAGLPAIAVSAAQGKFLEILARTICARRILEIGTLGGYSTIWLARGMSENGRLVTLELDEKHAAVAASNFDTAGFGDRIELKVGAALDLLPLLESGNPGPFDLTFIDADKANIPAYFEYAVRMSRPGSIIITDNVVRDGAVIDPASTDPSVIGVRRLNGIMASDPRVTSTILQTVGSKGYDGFAVALVR